MNIRHDNYVVYTILYTEQFISDFISYYLTYLSIRLEDCYTCRLPFQFSIDEIISRHGNQDLYYFMIIHRSITLNTATPGAHPIIL